MKRFLSSHPLLIGVVGAICLVWASGEALLGRHEGVPRLRIVAGDANVVRSTVGDVVPPGGARPEPLAPGIDREGTAEDEPSVWVHGRVSSREPTNAGTLAFRPAAGQGVQETRTSEDGFYELQLSQSGAHAIRFRPALQGAPAELALATTIPSRGEHELDLRLPSGRIEGRLLTLEDEPVPDASVTLTFAPEPGAGGTEAGGAGPGGAEAEATVASTTTDAEGRFRFCLLERDRYRVLARTANGERFAREVVEIVDEDGSAGVVLRLPVD